MSARTGADERKPQHTAPVRFWDSSALVTLLLEQPRSAHARTLAAEDGEMMVWWGSAVECASAIARLHRDGQLSMDG